MESKPPIPQALLADMRACLDAAHHDENVGVPIGARAMAFEVLDHFADKDSNVQILDLGSVFEQGVDWARDRCLNPIRLEKSHAAS